MQADCPSCGAPIVFTTSFSVYAVCGACGCAVVRHDRAVESIGTVADLPDEMTPFQVGTQLRHGGAAFILAGRLRLAWADGAWNEWYMVGDGTGAAAWLAEAQGTLAVSTERPFTDAQGLSADAPPPLGAAVTVGGVPFHVADLKQARCVGSEGELPFRAPPGQVTEVADMLGPAGGFATAEYGPDGVALFTGRYVTFNSLHTRNLREVEGWSSPDPA